MTDALMLSAASLLPSNGAAIRAHDLYFVDLDGPPLDSMPSWALTPDEVMHATTPMGRATRRWAEGPVRALATIHAENVRDYVHQQNAIDAPFVDIGRCRFAAFGGFVSAVSASHERSEWEPDTAASTELDTFKTKVPHREVIELDMLQSRVRKLGKAVRNTAHALDAAAHLSGGFRWRRLFVTLTYREVEDWVPGHVGGFTRHVRKWFQRVAKVPMRMTWVLELQKRGAVHYHAMIWIPARCKFPNPADAGWWPHGFSHVKAPPGGIQRPVSYMAKYASKVTTCQASRVPKGARMYGACGLDKEGKRWVRWWRAPLFARDALGGAADIRKTNGGYYDRETGLFCESPWKVSILPGGRVIAWRIVLPIEGESS
jgi:hypothetical protein